jgi:hypothetical protein
MPELIPGVCGTWGIGPFYSDIDKIPDDGAVDTDVAIKVDSGDL